jgi:hypothetical protein
MAVLMVSQAHHQVKPEFLLYLFTAMGTLMGFKRQGPPAVPAKTGSLALPGFNPHHDILKF